MKVIKKVLNSENEIVLFRITEIFWKLIADINKIGEEGSPYPLREELEKDGTLAKLIEIFGNENYNDRKINSWIACSIGSLFRSYPLPSEIKPFIIIYIKEKLDDSEERISFIALFTLFCLAENIGK